MRELYAEYRAFAVPKGEPRFDDVKDELNLLAHYAPLYETLEGRISVDADLAWFGRKMAAWQTTTVYPVAMQLGADTTDKVARARILKLLYSFVVRHALCGLTTKNLNNIFQSLAARFREDGASIATFRAFFDGRVGDSVRFPDDSELHQGVLEGNAYGISPQPRLVDILWELERASRSSFAEQHERPSDLWVEHVMPQTWTEAWPYADAEYADRWSDLPHAAARRSAINTLGNLTLVTSGLNISTGNKSFADKQSKFAEHTGLFLNKWFAQPARWSEIEIHERGEHLSRYAVTSGRTWMRPSGYSASRAGRIARGERLRGRPLGCHITRRWGSGCCKAPPSERSLRRRGLPMMARARTSEMWKQSRIRWWSKPIM